MSVTQEVCQDLGYEPDRPEAPFGFETARSAPSRRRPPIWYVRSTMHLWRPSFAGWGTTALRSSLTDVGDDAACLLVHTVAIDDLGASPTVLARVTAVVSGRGISIVPCRPRLRWHWRLAPADPRQSGNWSWERGATRSRTDDAAPDPGAPMPRGAMVDGRRSKARGERRERG